MIPVDLEYNAPEKFKVKHHEGCLGPITLGTAHMTRVQINQTSDHVGPQQGDLIKLTMPLSGLDTVSQDNNQTTVYPGQSCLFDPVRPFHEHTAQDLSFNWCICLEKL